MLYTQSLVYANCLSEETVHGSHLRSQVLRDGDDALPVYTTKYLSDDDGR